MRVNIFLVAISVLISALSGYGFYAANAGDKLKLSWWNEFKIGVAQGRNS